MRNDRGQIRTIDDAIMIDVGACPGFHGLSEVCEENRKIGEVDLVIAIRVTLARRRRGGVGKDCDAAETIADHTVGIAVVVDIANAQEFRVLLQSTSHDSAV